MRVKEVQLFWLLGTTVVFIAGGILGSLRLLWVSWFYRTRGCGGAADEILQDDSLLLTEIDCLSVFGHVRSRSRICEVTGVTGTVDVLSRSLIDRLVIFAAWSFWFDDRHWHEDGSKYEEVAINNVEERLQRLPFFKIWVLSKLEIWKNWIRRNKAKAIRFENEWLRKKTVRTDVWWSKIEKKNFFVSCDISVESSYDLTKSDFDETSILEITWRRKNTATMLSLLVSWGSDWCEA